MADYLQQEANTDRILTEDGSGAFLLETSAVLATVTGGGTLNASGAKGAAGAGAISGGGTITATGSRTVVTEEQQTGGNVLLRPPRRARLPRRPIDKTGVAHVTGAGNVGAHGTKTHAGQLVITATGTLSAAGSKSTIHRAIIRTGGNQHATGTRVAETLTLDDELRQLLEDAVVLSA